MKLNPRKAAKRTLFVIFLTVFGDLMGIDILIPIIPTLFTDPSSPYFMLDFDVKLSTGYLLLGILVALYSVGQFFAAPVLGELSDRYGRKKLLLFSLAGTVLSYIFFAIAIIDGNIWLLFVSRFVDGVTGGNISVAQAAIADITTPENRSRNFGLIGAAFGMGFIMGPFLGGMLGNTDIVSWFSATTPFWFAAGLVALDMIFVIFFLPETLPKEKRLVRAADAPRGWRMLGWHKSIVNVMDAWKDKNLRGLFGVNFLFQSGFTFITTFFGVFLISRFNFTETGIGNYFAFIGIWIAFSQAVLTRIIARRYDEVAVLKWALPLCGLLVLAHFIPPTWQLMILLAPPVALANGLTTTNITGLISRVSHESVQGEVLGTNTSVLALAQAIPPIISGVVAASAAAEAPMAVAGLLILGAGIWFIVIGNRYRTLIARKEAAGR